MSFRKVALGAACTVCVVVSGYLLNDRSIKNLDVRPPLVELSECAINRTPVYFIIIDGGRTLEEHLVNVKNGRSWVRRSRHQDGAAIDFVAVVNGQITYDPAPYYKIAEAFASCSFELKIPIVWGGEWKAQDLMHIELDRRVYP